jgi:hypothetical protein
MDPSYQKTVDDLIKQAPVIHEILLSIEPLPSNAILIDELFRSWFADVGVGPFQRRCAVMPERNATKNLRQNLHIICNELYQTPASIIHAAQDELAMLSRDQKFRKAVFGLDLRFGDGECHPRYSDTIAAFEAQLDDSHRKKTVKCAALAHLRRHCAFFDGISKLRGYQEPWEREYLGFQKITVPYPKALQKDWLPREQEEPSEFYHTRVRQELEGRYRESVRRNLESERTAFENEIRQRFEEQAEKDFEQYVVEETQRQAAMELENEAALANDQARVASLESEVVELRRKLRRAKKAALKNGPLLPGPENNVPEVRTAWTSLQEDEIRFKGMTKRIQELADERAVMRERMRQLADGEHVVVKHFQRLSEGELTRDLVDGHEACDAPLAIFPEKT